jgi:glycerol-3-phosphate dehydrogenase
MSTTDPPAPAPRIPRDRAETDERLTVAVLGAGSFGTALATLAARKGHVVRLYMRNAAQAEAINATRRNPRRFPTHELPAGITAHADVGAACDGAELIIHAVPAQATPAFLRAHRDVIPGDVPIVCTSKGIVADTLQLMSEAIPEALQRPADRPQPVAFLSGPSFAKEIMEGHPMAVVVASRSEAVALLAQTTLSSTKFRVYTTDDVTGVEVGGAIKNPLAIGAGMADGLGFGQSTIASIVTRGMAEMRRLATAMGGRPETLSGLSGVGDLMLTSFSALSRNRTLGFRMAAEGMTLEQAVASLGQVAEGVATARVAAALSRKHGLELPLFSAVHAVLAGKMDCAQAMRRISERPLHAEWTASAGLATPRGESRGCPTRGPPAPPAPPASAASQTARVFEPFVDEVTGRVGSWV